MMTHAEITSSLDELRISFENLLGFYLILIDEDHLSEDITFQIGDKNIYYMIDCNIINRTPESINFNYYFKIKENKLSFYEFYVYLFKEFHNETIQYYPNFIEKYILTDFFNKIEQSKFLDPIVKDLELYDSTHQNKEYKRYKQSILSEINDIGSVIEFEIKEIQEQKEKELDIDKNNTIFIQDILEGKFEADIKYKAKLSDIFKQYNLSSSFFELFYKQIITDNIADYLTIKEFDLLGLQNPRSFTPKYKAQEYKMYRGFFFPYLFLNNKEKFTKYFNLLNKTINIELSTPLYHLPYVLLFNNPKQFDYELFTDIEQSLFYGLTFSSKTRLNAYLKFIDNYFDEDEVSTESNLKVKELLIKKFNTFPLFYFNGDTFGLISCEVYKAENKITPRIILFNTFTHKNDKKALYMTNITPKLHPKDLGKLIKTLDNANDFFKELFDYYPYHPFFFTKRNHYAYFYTQYVLNQQNSEEEIEKKIEELYNPNDYITDLFELENITIPSPNELEGIEKKMRETISKVYAENLILWMMIYFEMFFLIWIKTEQNKPKSDRNFNEISQIFSTFIDDTMDYLEKKSKNQKKFNLISGWEHTIILEDQMFNMNGLYIFIEYEMNIKLVKIYKLNCVSFHRFELEIIKKNLSKKGINTDIKEVTIRHNFMKGLLIKDVSEEQFKEIKSIFSMAYKDLLNYNKISYLKEINFSNV